MDFNAIDQAVAQAARAKSIDTEVKARLDFIDEYGEDTFPDLTVWQFTRRFSANGHEYHYAAIKIGRNWFTTGPSQGKYTWDELVLWLVSGAHPLHPSDVMVLGGPGTPMDVQRAIQRGLQRAKDGIDPDKNPHEASRLFHEELDEKLGDRLIAGRAEYPRKPSLTDEVDYTRPNPAPGVVAPFDEEPPF